MKIKIPLKGCQRAILGLFMLFVFSSMLAQVTVDIKNKPIKEALKEIERKSSFKFFYNEDLKGLDKLVSIKLSDKDIDSTLKQLLSDSDISFQKQDNNIILLIPRKENSESKKLQKIKGIIKDETGEAIIGAALMIKGTSIGTITDIDGRFTLEAPDDTNLSISYIGYISQNIKIKGGNTNLQIILKENPKELDEVVVVGYGIQKKSVVTGAISSVKSQDLGKIAPSRIDNVLKGMVSGVSIMQSSGQPGDGSRVRIRGVGTINNSEPLYIVDGMPIGGGINYLNPSDIESVEVLKDAASAAIYGSRAANGVILVTTKLGDKGKARLEYNTSFGWQNPWRKRDVLNAKEYAMLMNERRMNDGETPLYNNLDQYGEGTDWQDKVFNDNAPVVEHQVNIGGGTEKASYYLSLGYLYQEGIVGGNYNRSNYERYSTRFNNNYIIWDDQKRTLLKSFKVGSNISYSRIISKSISTNSERGTPLSAALMMSPLMDVYADNPDDIFDKHPTAVADFNGNPFTIVDSQYGGVMNPVAMLHLPGDKNNSDKIVANFWAEAELYKNLKIKSSYGADLGFWGNDGYVLPYYLGQGNYIDKSSVWSSMNRSYTWLLENVINYSAILGELHNFSFLLGQSAQSYRGQNLGGTSFELRNPEQPYIDATDQPSNEREAWGSLSAYHKLASYFVRMSYNYGEKYLLEATLRRDGSSNFGKNNKWANFPSVSVGWNITNEKFMEGCSDLLSSLKLRGSWGKNGNQSIGEFMYTSTISGNTNYILGQEGLNTMVPGSTPTAYSNPNLKWEESVQTNIGFDAILLNGAINFTLDWFSKKTNGMLMTMALPQYIGNSRPYGNVGDMENSGIELDFRYRFKMSDIAFNLGGNASYIKNKLIRLGNDSGWANYDNALGGIGTFTRAENGEPFPFFYGMKTDGLFQTEQEVLDYVNSNGELLQPNAQPGDVRFVDTDENGIINEDDRVKIGNGMPDWTFGFNLGAEWRGFDFSAFFHATVGNDIFDVSRRTDLPPVNLPAYMLKRWTGPGSSNKIPRLSNDLSNNNWRSSDLYVHDGSFLRLRNLQIGYTLPISLTSKFHIQKLRVYANAENLLTLTKYDGFDPEISSGGTSLGVDRGVYPQARVFSVGASINL